MNDTIKDILKSQQRKCGLLQGTNVMHFSDRVFFTVYGSIVNSHSINRSITNALKELDAKGIHIEHFTAQPYNPKSGRVMEKADMKLEGILRASGRNNQGICDMVWHSILKQEYER